MESRAVAVESVAFASVMWNGARSLHTVQRDLGAAAVEEGDGRLRSHRYARRGDPEMVGDVQGPTGVLSPYGAFLCEAVADKACRCGLAVEVEAGHDDCEVRIHDTEGKNHVYSDVVVGEDGSYRCIACARGMVEVHVVRDLHHRVVGQDEIVRDARHADVVWDTHAHSQIRDLVDFCNISYPFHHVACFPHQARYHQVGAISLPSQVEACVVPRR